MVMKQHVCCDRSMAVLSAGYRVAALIIVELHGNVVLPSNFSSAPIRGENEERHRWLLRNQEYIIYHGS